MDLFFILLILLVVTRSFGEVAEWLGQPALVGELVAGIVLGTLAAQQTDLIPHLTGLNENPVFDSITDLGMFFIIFSAVVIMAVLTTLVTPLLLKRVYAGVPP